MSVHLRCVACGEEMDEPQNHHCDPLLESRIEAGRHSHDDLLPSQRRLTEAQRLNMGLELMYPDDED